MAIRVRNDLVQDLLAYLDSKGDTDPEADRLYAELLVDQTETDYEELKAEGKLPPPTQGGAYIIG